MTAADRNRAGREQRAAAVAHAGSVRAALEHGLLEPRPIITVAEGVVLGLLLNGVRDFLVVLGHGSTELGEVLRIYDDAGVVRTHPVRHETEASHAAAALRWVTGKRAAVVTSIGPGALHALAGSLVPASDGIGVWYLLGDETTEDEGPNMQQIPRPEQGLYLRLAATLGSAYSLHTPEALGPALRRGVNVVEHPHRPGPFHLLLPINVQPAELVSFNLAELPEGGPPPLGAAGEASVAQAAAVLRQGRRVVVKVGGGARGCGAELAALLDELDAVAVLAPHVPGLLPASSDRVMGVGGSKGSISGNFAMETADTLLVVGSRSVCQADCSRTGYPLVERVVNVNADVDAALHYNRTVALVGDARATLTALLGALAAFGGAAEGPDLRWLAQCRDAKARWRAHRRARIDVPVLHDPVWGAEVLTQPAAIHAVATWAAQVGARLFFDAGDPQANGFQLVDDEEPGRTFTETGASYMGFAASALLATALADEPFYGVAVCGDGSFTMNPQVLVDGVAVGATGCLVVLDNRRMAAISGLQRAQYGRDHATSDAVAVDYVAWARSVRGVHAEWGGTSPAELLDALERCRAHPGLSLVHVPVYFGDDPLGGLGTFGRWNVGNWVEDTQRMRHDLAL